MKPRSQIHFIKKKVTLRGKPTHHFHFIQFPLTRLKTLPGYRFGDVTTRVAGFTCSTDVKTHALKGVNSGGGLFQLAVFTTSILVTEPTVINNNNY